MSASAALNGAIADSNGHAHKSLLEPSLCASEPRTTPTSAAPVSDSAPVLELDDSFDDLLALTAQFTGAPLVVLVAEGEKRCWLADAGAVEEDLWRELRFCSEVVDASDGLTVIKDTAANKYWQAHPFVRSEPRIRFFVGTPLVTEDGRVLGLGRYKMALFWIGGESRMNGGIVRLRGAARKDDFVSFTFDKGGDGRASIGNDVLDLGAKPVCARGVAPLLG